MATVSLSPFCSFRFLLLLCSLPGHIMIIGIYACTQELRDACGQKLYSVEWKVLNARKHGGLPQNRERLFIAGIQHQRQRGQMGWPAEVIHKNPITILLLDFSSLCALPLCFFDRSPWPP